MLNYVNGTLPAGGVSLEKQGGLERNNVERAFTRQSVDFPYYSPEQRNVDSGERIPLCEFWRE